MGECILEKYKESIGKVEEFYRENKNIFKILRVEEYENRHSLFLSWLFDIKASHGLGKEFLERFLKESCKDFCDDKFKFIQSVKVETEVLTSEKRRIDILIVGEGEGYKFTCTIENKYGSSEHGDQCGDYREDIEGRRDKENKNPKGGRYPLKEEWENFFVYLDIKKPDNFDDDKEKYADYEFISYQQIKDILEDILKDRKCEEQIELSFIEQYKDVLEEKYKLPEKLKNICDKIYDKDVKVIVDLCEKDCLLKLSESQKLFVQTVKKHYEINKRNNDEYIRKILEEIVVDKKKIKTNYGSGHKPKDGVSYAYAIEVEDIIDVSFIKSVDFTAIDGLCIDIYGGLTPTGSFEFVKYINEDTDGFLKNLNDIKNNGWNCILSYRICPPNNYLNKGIIADIVLDIEDKNKIKELVKTDYVKWRSNGEDKSTMVEKVETCFKELMHCNYKDASQRSPQKIKEGIECIYDTGKGITAAWCLKLSFELDVYTITNANKEEIKKKFKDRTREGLSLFKINEKKYKCFFN